jgi:putative transposase
VESDDDRDLHLLKKIMEIWNMYPFMGYRRITFELWKGGVSISRKQTRRIMHRFGILAIMPKRNLSKAAKMNAVYPYLLRGKVIRYPNQVWASDITYLKLPQGHVYLVIIMDIYSRKVLGYRISNTLDARFCVDLLEDTIHKYGEPAIFNTDQGCQFTSEAFLSVLRDHAIEISMDGKGRALDNIFVERFWRTLKYEDIYIRSYENVEELKQGLNRYFTFYNSERLHQSLDYRTPEELYESFQEGSGSLEAA